MARIIHINCPKCGGTLGMAGMERIVDCRFCGTRSLVEAPGTVPEYYVEPSISEAEAQRSVQNFLTDDDVPKGLRKSAQFHSARLYFVPYYEFYGRRLGTKTSTRYEREKRKIQPTGAGFRSAVMDYYRMEGQQALRQETVDTRVMMMEMTGIEPAIELEEWALEYSDLISLRKKAGGGLQPIDRRALERKGSVFDAGLSVEQVLSKLNTRLFPTWNKENTRIAEDRLKRIYYPVWRIRYDYQGKMYGATVDGVTGRLMSARAPQDDSLRVLWFLGSSAVVSFTVGMILKFLFIAISSESPDGELSKILFFGTHFIFTSIQYWLLAGGLSLLIIGMGWDQFRYQGEVVIRGDVRTVKKLGKPENTWYDKTREKLLGYLSELWYQQQSPLSRS